MTLRAFLAEDSADTRQALTSVLTQLANIEVVGYSNHAVHASDWLLVNDNKWDIAVIDLELCGGSGLTVFAACRVRAAHQHAVVFSSSATSDLRQRCFDFGADAVFDKITDAEALIRYCSALVDARM